MRVLSVDVMRGLVMLLLAGEACGLYHSLHEIQPEGIWGLVLNQFEHHPWHGLRFWDLVQPAFMFIAGTAMYFSWQGKMKKGISWRRNLKHIAFRSLKLFLLGTALHCIYAGKMVWELWNVLTQLSFTTLIAYLIIERSIQVQLFISVVLLLITEILYRTILIPGFDQPFVESHNFGAFFDTLLMNKINSDGWVAINIIPTAAHTIWGVIAGKVLATGSTANRKIGILVISGVIGLLIGFGLDVSDVTPIIKRISTSSFVFASGGWVLLILAFLYWLTDVKQLIRHAWIFVSIGMNSIFIYLFFETVGVQWFNGAVEIFTGGIADLFSLTNGLSKVINAVVVLFLEWYLCYWLYSRKIFIKI